MPRLSVKPQPAKWQLAKNTENQNPLFLLPSFKQVDMDFMNGTTTKYFTEALPEYTISFWADQAKSAARWQHGCQICFAIFM